MTSTEIKKLVDQLNHYREAYYTYNQSLISDEQYDELFDKLLKAENETGYIFPDSPTRTVGYIVQDKLNKVKHDHPMLSLGKTKDYNDIIKFINKKAICVMLKMDGLTCSLHYDSNGNLSKAETRGNGIIGEDILENAKQISNIPLHIENNGIPLTVDGEVIVDYKTFNKINENLELKYSHPRNLASGSIRQLDTKITRERNLKFIAWRVIEGGTNLVNESLNNIQALGIDTVPRILIETNSNTTIDALEAITDTLQSLAKVSGYPIDGLVFAYDDVKYGLSLGFTGHHPQHSMAFKFYDDCYETVLRDIEWNTSRTGMVAPVAVFDEVDLDGALTTRASLSNVSIIKELKLGIGDKITVYRANQVIPHINENLTKSNSYKLPTKCPCCGKDLKLKKDGIAEMLFCDNLDCSAKIAAKFEYFVSRNCVNIDGLSEVTIEKFINLGFIKTFKDIYHLDNFMDQIINLEGFGEKSYNKLIKAINKSRVIKLENFITALGINQIGVAASKTISKYFKGSYTKFIEAIENNFDFTILEDFGKVANDSIYEFFTSKKIREIDDLVKEFQFESYEEPIIVEDNFIKDKIFVITGSFSKPRKEYEEFITSHGGKLGSSVTSKTNYLLTNDKESGSAKNKKAQELNIPILSEEEFLEACK